MVGPQQMTAAHPPLGGVLDGRCDYPREGENVTIKMTLTAPGCPVGPMIASEIENKLLSIGAEQVAVSFVWSPPWSTEKVTPDGKLQLQMMGIPV
jgi:metal-sulfur cluster biosynthetic enzyme